MRSAMRVASCQFSVEADIDHNLKAIVGQISQAAELGARIVHFSETALSGYAGVDFDSIDQLDWEQLQSATETILEEARRNKVWVLLGSTHRLSAGQLPHNCVYVINDQGEIVERYDKRFCTGTLDPTPSFDLEHYSPGDWAALFEVDGFLCSTLICYDYRFPELYRDLVSRGVEIVFQSFHNARRTKQEHEEENIWKEIVPATMMCRASENHIWISATNSMGEYSSWPSFFVNPDGRIAGKLGDHETSILVSTVDPAQKYWDAAGPWRDRSIAGRLHSGQITDNPRSTDRTCH